MDKNKLKVGAIALTSTLVLLGAVYGGSVYAQEYKLGMQDTFVETLANRLGLPEEKVQSALTEAHATIRSERQEQRQEAIDTAIAEKKLTQRQADILSAIDEVREERFNRGERMLGQRNPESMIDDLKDNGFTVTAQELEELHEAMQELGFGSRGANRGGMHRGMGI